jgi:hypothetical protein
MAIVPVQAAHAGMPFRQPVLSEKSAELPPSDQEDTFTSAETLRQTFEATQEQGFRIQRQWQTFLEGLLDDNDRIAQPSSEPLTEKSVAKKAFQLLKAFTQNRRAFVNIVDQAKQQGLTQFEYRISLDDRSHTYDFSSAPQDAVVANVFEQQLQSIEQHPVNSDQFVRAVQDFVNDVRD